MAMYSIDLEVNQVPTGQVAYLENGANARTILVPSGATSSSRDVRRSSSSRTTATR
jgi:hypothetical protein